MSDIHKCVYMGGTKEIVEKKSRFIGSIMNVNTEEEAIEIINQIKKKNWDAAHNCFAYIIGPNNEIQKCSDDKEPAKTAGRPILDVLLGEELHNVLAIVTRYFGGTLLGTGGLIRAYSKATQEALKECTIINKLYGLKVKIETDYNYIGKIQYITSKLNINILKIQYLDIVILHVLVTSENITKLKNEITDLTSAKATIEEQNWIHFAQLDNDIITFEDDNI